MAGYHPRAYSTQSGKKDQKGKERKIGKEIERGGRERERESEGK